MKNNKWVQILNLIGIFFLIQLFLGIYPAISFAVGVFIGYFLK